MKSKLKTFCIALMCCLMVYAPFSDLRTAYANGGVAFDRTFILDDLEGMTINGQAFNEAAWIPDPFGQIEVITFLEYCFSSFMASAASLILRLMRAFPRPDFVTFVRPGACVSADSTGWSAANVPFW